MKIGICAVLALAGTVWAFGSNNATLPESDPLAAPPPVIGPVPGDTPCEGRIVLWRDGHPIAFAPGTERTHTLCTGFDGKAGRLRIGPDGKVLIYLANRPTLRPVDPKKQDKLYLRVGLETKEVDVGGYSCYAFWGADGVVYGYGFVAPKWGDPEPPPNLTADLLNWSFDPRTGKLKSLKLPGNVSVLDRSPDGKAFLVLRYERPRNPPAEAPVGAAQYRLGLLPADGGEFVPLTRFGESTPGDFRFSPDGGFALGTVYRTVSGFEFPDLVVFDLKTNARTAVAVPKDARVGTACWSPDGKRIAFVWESQAAFAERNKVLPGPVNPGQKTKPKYIVTVARPDGSDAKDVYTEAEYGCGSIDWSAAHFPVDQLPEKPNGDKLVRGEGQIALGREGHPRELLYPDKPGPTPIIGRLTVNSHAMKQDTQVFSVGLEIDNLTGSEATLHFDPKALKLELLDAKGKIVEESPTVRSGPAPMAHKATIPTSGYVGISTYRGGIGLTPKTILLAAGQQAWVLKPGTYRVRGTVTVSVVFGGKVLDPEKPEAPEPKPGNPFQTLQMELVGCRFELKMDENAPDR